MFPCIHENIALYEPTWKRTQTSWRELCIPVSHFLLSWCIHRNQPGELCKQTITMVTPGEWNWGRRRGLFIFILYILHIFLLFGLVFSFFFFFTRSMYSFYKSKDSNKRTFFLTWKLFFIQSPFTSFLLFNRL